MPIALPQDAILRYAERRTERAVNISKKMFYFAETDAGFEKDIAREEEKSREYNDEREEFDGECDLKDVLADIKEELNDVGRLCVVYLHQNLLAILSRLLRGYGGLRDAPSKFGELESAFMAKLQINFAGAPEYEHVREIHHARNCIVHNNSETHEKFRKEVPGGKLLNEEDVIVIGRDNLDHCINVFAKFLKFVIHSVADRKGIELR